MYKSKISIAILILILFSPLVSASPDHRRDGDRRDGDRHDRYERHYDGDRYGRHERHHDNDRYEKQVKHHKHNGNHGHRHYAKVIRVKPLYETIRIKQPHRACRHREHHHADVSVVHQHSPEGVIAGGVIGGIIGHELGHPANRGLSTLAGVVIGSAIARDATSRNYVYSEQRHRHSNHCRKHDRYIEKQKLVGYQVKYKYRGRIYVTHTDHHPGKRLPVRPGKRRVMY